MIKKIAMLFAVGIVTGLLSSFITGQQVSVNPGTDMIAVDKSSNIVLDFTGAGIKVEGWDKDEVLINALSPMIDGKYENDRNPGYKIVAEKNNIRLAEYSISGSIVYELETWLPLVQFEKYENQHDGITGISINMNTSSSGYSFLIFAPKDVPLEITADRIKVSSGCTLAHTNAEVAVIEDSNLIKGFTSEGGAVEISNCTINHDSSFRNKTLKMKGNKFVDN